MLNETLYKAVSEKLFELFFVDDRKYGRQLDNGLYKLVREKVSVVTIDDMLINSKSLLTYQETHTLNQASLKWICIDLDITKKEIDEHGINPENLKNVRDAAEIVCDFLKSIEVEYLLEFSGNRGFHIWIIFERLQSKEFGFELIKYITTQISLPPTIGVDKYPKTRDVSRNTKMVGFGVKLPLSQNKNSQKLSHLIRRPEDFKVDNPSPIRIATDEFLTDQLDILSKFSPLNEEKVEALRKMFPIYENDIVSDRGYLFKTRSIIKDPEGKDLDSVLQSLRKCDHLREKLQNYQMGMGNKDRNLFVGLLGNLSSTSNSNLGIDLLEELFARMKNYRKDLTEEKLKFAKSFFPVTCAELGRCEHCKCEQISSPIEILDVTLEKIPSVGIHNILERDFENLKLALRKYSLINDEIPLFHLLKKIENASYLEVFGAIEDVYQGTISPDVESYTFHRNEDDKVRTLHSLSPVNNLVSTYFLYVLNSLFYSEISDASYGYRLSPGLHGSNIFGNWFLNWAKFSKKISHILESEEFSGYFLVKVDIKSYYDKLDLQTLKIKMYEEAPSGVQEKLNRLSPQEKQRYRYIIDYLLAVSDNTTGGLSGQGVPQGPAYARFLAEIYLIGLDKAIETVILKDRKREFYYRFVDDIFVFVEDEEKANDVFKAIDKWMRINSLEFNPLKSEVVDVKEYLASGKYTRYQDDAKYLINKANKNKALLSDKEIREALSRLSKLTNDVKFGLKDNLRFFYYQFSGDSRLKSIKDRLLKFIPYSDVGRGTLYMMFYNDLITYQPEKFMEIAVESDRLHGLSLGQYLNTILMNEEVVWANIEFLEPLLKSISKRTDLGEVEKVLLLTISKLYRISLSSDFLKSCSKTLIYSAMETPQITFTEDDFAYLETILEEKKEKKLFVKELYRIIIQNPLTAKLAEKLSVYTINRFSEWINLSSLDELINDENSVLEFYHALCFFSLFYKSDSNSRLLECWGMLIEKSEIINLSEPLRFEWLTRAVEYPREEFAEKSHYTMLLTTKEGSPLKKHKCQHGFLKQFQSILLVFLFSKDIDPNNFDGEAKDKLDSNSLFEEWLYDDNVRLYPKDDKDVCVKNLALNGLIVLERDEELFAKRVNDDGELRILDYLDVNKEVNGEVQLSKKETINIYEESSDFTSLLKLIVEFIRFSREFMDKHKLHYPVYYKQPYSKGSFPLIPFYSEFSHKISAHGATQLNDIAAFWENIMHIVCLKNSQLELISGNKSKFNFKVADFDERFFPKSKLIINTTEDKFDFLEAFVLAMGEIGLSSAQQFQYFWSNAVWDMLKAGRSNSNITAFLGVHLQNFPEKEHMPHDVLFAVTERMKICDDNLEEFHLTLLNSLIEFQLQVQTNEDFSIADILKEEIAVLNAFLIENRSGELKDFKKVALTFASDINVDTGKSELSLQLNGITCEGKNILAFTREPIGFFPVDLNYLSIEQKEVVFAYNDQDAVLLFIPDNEFIRAYEKVADRFAFILKAQGLPQYEGLFPEDENYLIANQSYDDCDFNELERKLGLHYSSSKNVREHVVRWLSLINDRSIAGSKFEAFLLSRNLKIQKVYRALLDLVIAHQEISQEAFEDFCKKIENYAKNPNMILFPLKNPENDKNGLFRLLAKYGFKDRKIHFENIARRMFTQDCSGKTLVIIADVAITGGQTKSSLTQYLKTYSTEEEFETDMRGISVAKKYFLPRSRSEAETFSRNWENLEKIIFMSPLLTDVFKENFGALPFVQSEKVSFDYTQELKDQSYSYKNAGLDDDQEMIINNLLTDRELLGSLFHVENPEESFPSLEKIPGLNILLRIGSLPRRHIRLLSMEMKRGKISLFDYIDNWA